MTDCMEVAAGEKSVDELIAAMESGRRVLVRAEFLGTEREMTLRRSGGTFYCETPTRLHKHDSRDEMTACLEERGYARA